MDENEAISKKFFENPKSQNYAHNVPKYCKDDCKEINELIANIEGERNMTYTKKILIDQENVKSTLDQDMMDNKLTQGNMGKKLKMGCFNTMFSRINQAPVAPKI